MRVPSSLLVGLMWFDPDLPNAPAALRHNAEDRDGEYRGEERVTTLWVVACRQGWKHTVAAVAADAVHSSVRICKLVQSMPPLYAQQPWYVSATGVQLPYQLVSSQDAVPTGSAATQHLPDPACAAG